MGHGFFGDYIYKWKLDSNSVKGKGRFLGEEGPGLVDKLGKGRQGCFLFFFYFSMDGP